MNRNTLKRIVFAFGFLALPSLFLFYTRLGAQTGEKEPSSSAKIRYTSQDLRDPFQSPFEIGREGALERQFQYDLPHLAVQGIVWGSKMPQAIINNQVVKIGEVINGAEILDICKEGVYVLYEGRQYILRPVVKK